MLLLLHLILDALACSRRSKMNEEMAEEAKKKVVKAWGKLLPFGAQVVASAAAYTVGVTATQVWGLYTLAQAVGLTYFSKHAKNKPDQQAATVSCRHACLCQSGVHCTAC